MLWTDDRVALGGDDGVLWHPFTQLVTVMVDVVNIVLMEPLPSVSVTGHVVTVVYVVKVSVPLEDGDGALVQDDGDNDREGDFPTVIIGVGVVEGRGTVGRAAPLMEREVELEPHGSWCVAAAQPKSAAAKSINEACIVEMISWKEHSECEVDSIWRSDRQETERKYLLYTSKRMR